MQYMGVAARRKALERMRNPEARPSLQGTSRQYRRSFDFDPDGLAEEDSYPGRIAGKTRQLYEQLLALLEKYGALSAQELAELDGTLTPTVVYGHMRHMMHDERVKAFIEISSTNLERMVFVSSRTAPSGLWNRYPILGYETTTNHNRHLTVSGDKVLRIGKETDETQLRSRLELKFAAKALDLIIEARRLPRAQAKLAKTMFESAADMVDVRVGPADTVLNPPRDTELLGLPHAKESLNLLLQARRMGKLQPKYALKMYETAAAMLAAQVGKAETVLNPPRDPGILGLPLANDSLKLLLQARGMGKAQPKYTLRMYQTAADMVKEPLSQ